MQCTREHNKIYSICPAKWRPENVTAESDHINGFVDSSLKTADPIVKAVNVKEMLILSIRPGEWWLQGTRV